MLTLQASVLETDSSMKSSWKFTGRMVLNQPDSSPRLKYLREMIWFWWNQAALQQKGFAMCPVPSAHQLSSQATQQEGKHLEVRRFNLSCRITTTRNVRFQKSKNVQLLCNSVAWSLQNRSLSSLAPQLLGNCHGRGFWGSCFTVKACLLTSWWTFRRLDIPKPRIPHSNSTNSVKASMLLCHLHLNKWEYLTFRKPDFKVVASNFLPAWAPPAFRMLCSGAACPMNCNLRLQADPKDCNAFLFHRELKVHRWIINWLAVHILLDSKITVFFLPSSFLASSAVSKKTVKSLTC